MNNKGFTLVELLAVIIILALLAVLVSTSVTNIVRDSKKDLYDSQFKFIEDAAQAWGAENIYMLPDTGECKYLTIGDLKSSGFLEPTIKNPKTNEEISDDIIIKISSNSTKYGNSTLTYEVDSDDIKLCHYAYSYEESNNISIPNLLNDTLTPVVYDGENWIVADPTEKWYSYKDQEWANAVILNSSVSKNVGDIVTVDGDNPDALAMFVYIPRYEYKIEGVYGTHTDGTAGTSETPGEIKVNFISKETTTAHKGYIIHSAFTFGGEELPGIWVGKFETSHTTLSSSTTDNNLGCSTEECESADGLRILPNVVSLRSNNVSNFFFASRSMGRSGNPFGIDPNVTDSHMMKNSEWGAVAYLSQSKYGKYGNSNYTGTNKEIYQNKSSSFITGSSNGTPSDSTTNTQCTYNDTTNNCGIGASTTGNIYGVYDMSGGAWDRVMGVYANSVGELYSGYGLDSNSGFTGKIGTSETDYNGVPFPNPKYYDIYKNNSEQSYLTPNSLSCNGDACNGHALSETIDWYSDYANFVSASYPWFDRGGSATNDAGAGIFNFYSDYGNSYPSSMRVVFVQTK